MILQNLRMQLKVNQFILVLHLNKETVATMRSVMTGWLYSPKNSLENINQSSHLSWICGFFPTVN